jgi:hypothetical protein
MKVNVEEKCSSSKESIIYTITSSTSLMYFRILTSKNCEEIKVFHNLVVGLTSKGFCITNLTFFVMVGIDKDL